MRTRRFPFLTLCLLLCTRVLGAENERANTNRSEAIRALCARLEIGPGAVVADVGCGSGSDSMVFARLVGERGTVLAEEISADSLKKVIETSTKEGFRQVVPVLGQSDDPRLPNGLANLIYMNRVFHHFAQPQAMLTHMWQDLKPGGFLAIVDQQKGHLTEWVPTEKREKEHHWTGETTVVRLAREAGFLFHDALEDCWHERQPFVLVFRKPAKPLKTPGDPDLPRPLRVDRLVQSLPAPRTNEAVICFALGQGRAAVPPWREMLPAPVRFFDVILDEWALSREELPAEAPCAGTEILRLDKGSLTLPAGNQAGGVLFVDSYHRLWDPVPLLRQLKDQMPSSGWVAVADRKGPAAEPRRLANHRRRISSKLVLEEMRRAGFRFQRKLPAPARDRFFLLFSPDKP